LSTQAGLAVALNVRVEVAWGRIRALSKAIRASGKCQDHRVCWCGRTRRTEHARANRTRQGGETDAFNG